MSAYVCMCVCLRFYCTLNNTNIGVSDEYFKHLEESFLISLCANFFSSKTDYSEHFFFSNKIHF